MHRKPGEGWIDVPDPTVGGPSQKRICFVRDVGGVPRLARKWRRGFRFLTPDFVYLSANQSWRVTGL